MNFTIFSLVICTVAHRLIIDFFFRIVPGEASPVVEYSCIMLYSPHQPQTLSKANKKST